MLGAVPIRTWLTLIINIFPSDLVREVVLRTENVITSNSSHQTTIPLLHLAQLFRQIDEFVALDINMVLLEAINLCRTFTLLVVPFTIGTSDTVPIA